MSWPVAFSMKGDSGSQGARGPQGIQGIQGIQGPQGPPGTSGPGDGTTLLSTINTRIEGGGASVVCDSEFGNITASTATSGSGSASFSLNSVNTVSLISTTENGTSGLNIGDGTTKLNAYSSLELSSVLGNNSIEILVGGGILIQGGDGPAPTSTTNNVGLYITDTAIYFNGVQIAPPPTG